MTEDRRLPEAYLETDYVVHAGDRDIVLRVGEQSAGLDALLAGAQAEAWAFVTAWNPGSRPLPPGENAVRQQDLVALLESRGLRWLPGVGRARDGGWSEESVLVLGIEPEEADGLGRRFGQKAIVRGRRSGPAILQML